MNGIDAVKRPTIMDRAVMGVYPTDKNAGITIITLNEYRNENIENIFCADAVIFSEKP